MKPPIVVMVMVLWCVLVPMSAQAQDQRCFVLCAPDLKIEPTFAWENLFRPPRIAETDNQGNTVVRKAARERVFEAVIADRYTHKLNLELDTAVPFLKWTKKPWLSDVEIEGSLDYVVSGLPRAGDRFGNAMYLDDASRWSFSLVFVFPLAPLPR